MKKKAKRATPPKKKKTSGVAVRTGQEQLVFRPERLAYVTRKGDDKECVFCLAIRSGVSQDSLILWESETVAIIMNKYPYNNGHLLVVPKRHLADLNDLNSEEFQELHLGIQRAINALRKAATKGPDGFNVGLNLGRAAGAGLPGHLHYHVIPRWVGDSNFFPIVGQTKVISETLEQTYKRLITCF